MKFNKGEWSELYVGLLTLKTKVIPLYNSSKSIKVKKIGYQPDKLKTEKDVPELDKAIKKFYKTLTEPQKRTFDIQDEDIIKRVIFEKGTSYTKADIYLNYIIDNIESTHGFSIKSDLAGSPTLLNASGATNFIYEVSKENISKLKGLKKPKEILRAAKAEKILVKYSDCESATFKANLRKADSAMDEIMALVTLNYYSGKDSKLSELIENSFSGAERDRIKIRVKDFLYYVTTGMFPNREWDGVEQVVGCILLSSNNELSALHRIDINNFKEYLYQNVKLETASTTRHGFGKFYEVGSKVFINLNLQIRMI